MRPFFHILFVALLIVTSLAEAQSTFIKRYKNSPLPEGSVAVANLPDNRIAIIGQQSNGFAWQSPMVVNTDSAGNQLRHFVDTSCYVCDVFDGTTDSAGFIYVVGTFYGKAGLAKYDTIGNKVWQRELSTNGESANYTSVMISQNTNVVAGGSQNHNGSFESWLLMSAYDLQGNLQWVIDSNFGNTAPEAQVGVLGLNADENWVYATGVSYDTLPQRAVYLKVDNFGLPAAYKELSIGRKWGYGIIPLSTDSILIAGRADNSFGGQYSFLSMVDSMGNVRYTIEDSNYLLTSITDIDFDFPSSTLYTLSYDTFDNIGTPTPLARVSAYNYPVVNLQQPEWYKTVRNTSATASAHMGLILGIDNKILHSSTISTNCPYCPYLLKADENTCADIACDTFFYSEIKIPASFDASLKLYPNPVSCNFVFIELGSDIPIEMVSVSCFDLSGRILPVEVESNFVSPNFYKARLDIGNALSKGIYMVRLTVNNSYALNSRFVKTN